MSLGLLSRQGRASIAGHLLYDSYDSEGNVFVHRDGSLAIAWTVGMKDTEIASPTAIREIADHVADFFKRLPTGSAGQFILEARKDIQESLEVFRAAGDPESRLRGLFDAHCEMLAKLSIPYGGTTYTGRTLKLYFTLRVFPALGRQEDQIRAERIEPRAGRQDLLSKQSVLA